MTKAELEAKELKTREQSRARQAKFKKVGANIRLDEYEALEKRLEDTNYKSVSEYVKSLLEADKVHSEALIELKRTKAELDHLKQECEELKEKNTLISIRYDEVKKLNALHARSWWSRLLNLK